MPKNRHPIPVYLPYLAGTADERQYRVMTDRESWFRIVMGQEEVARIIPNEAQQSSAGNFPQGWISSATRVSRRNSPDIMGWMMPDVERFAAP